MNHYNIISHQIPMKTHSTTIFRWFSYGFPMVLTIPSHPISSEPPAAPVEVALRGPIPRQLFKGPQPAIDALELLAHVQALRPGGRHRVDRIGIDRNRIEMIQ